MGFMDKAKKLAEQAQEKLDEAQKNFNKGEGGSQQPAEGGVKYDEHGRPVEQETPAAATPPPPATPAPEPTAPAAPSSVDQPTEEAPAPPPPAPPSEGGANSSPDPFKPPQQ